MISKLQSNGGILYSSSGNYKTLHKHSLFIFNYLMVDAEGKSASDHLWHLSTTQNYAQAVWEDPLSNKWQGPDPVLIWGKGHACVYDIQVRNTRWLPECLIKLYNPPRQPPEKVFNCA